MNGYRPQRWVLRSIVGTLGALVALRFAVAIQELRAGDETAVLTLPLGVLFPALLVTALIGMPPTLTREGLLMRLATATHLLLIVAFPPIALHLALGLPVVFLVVELFETRVPAPMRDRVARALLT